MEGETNKRKQLSESTRLAKLKNVEKARLAKLEKNKINKNDDVDNTPTIVKKVEVVEKVEKEEEPKIEVSNIKNSTVKESLPYQEPEYIKNIDDLEENFYYKKDKKKEKLEFKKNVLERLEYYNKRFEDMSKKIDGYLEERRINVEAKKKAKEIIKEQTKQQPYIVPISTNNSLSTQDLIRQQMFPGSFK